jgi:DNA-binding transcriptional ArsR family regulator
MSSVAADRLVLAPAVALFGSLADPTRLAIVRELAVAPARVVDLTVRLGLAQSTVSQHLACLRDCGLVAARPVGRSSEYALAQPALNELLSAAETVLGDTGNAVGLCRTYGSGRQD